MRTLESQKKFCKRKISMDYSICFIQKSMKSSFLLIFELTRLQFHKTDEKRLSKQICEFSLLTCVKLNRGSDSKIFTKINSLSKFYQCALLTFCIVHTMVPTWKKQTKNLPLVTFCSRFKNVCSISWYFTLFSSSRCAHFSGQRWNEKSWNSSLICNLLFEFWRKKWTKNSLAWKGHDCLQDSSLRFVLFFFSQFVFLKNLISIFYVNFQHYILFWPTVN